MKLKSATLCFFILIISSECFAGKLEKGFERLHVFDYFNAKDLFEQSLEKRTAGAAYGLSVIYSLNNNPFYNLDSARRYILMCDSAFQHVKEKEKKRYDELGVNAMYIQAQKDSICERAFKTLDSFSTLTKLNGYLQNYAFCSQMREATELRNAVAYREVKLKNTSGAYKNFLDTYPGAKEQSDATARYEERIYEEATSDKKITSYEKYISSHPGSAYLVKAEDMIYTLSVPHKNMEEYYSYLKKYPRSRHAGEAWREIFNLYTKDYSEQVLANFKKQYPDYPFKNELESDYELQRSFFLPFSRNNLWGFINEDGKEMIKPEYEEVSLFSEGLAAAQKDGKYGYISKSGKAIVPFLYDDAEAFKNNTAIVTKNEKSGLINRNGEELIPVMYDNLSDPSEGFYVATLNGKSGYLTKSGSKLTDFIFDFAGDFKDGNAIAGIEEKFGLLGSSGSFIMEPQYDEMVYLSNGLLKANQNEHWGIVNVRGDLVAPFTYDAVGDFSDGRALVAKNKKCGFIDEEGSIVIPLIYLFQESFITTAMFKNGHVLLKQKMKSVLLDSLGTKISFPGFDETGLPSEGMVPVRKNKRWGFAGMDGKVKISCLYDAAGSFENGLVKVKLKKLTGVIDIAGAEVIPPSFDDITSKNNYFIVFSGGRAGLMSVEGKTILPCEYERIEFLSDKIVSAFLKDHPVYMNLQSGKIIWR